MAGPSGKLLRHFGPPLEKGVGTAMRRRDDGAEKVLLPAKSAVARPVEVEGTVTKSE